MTVPSSEKFQVNELINELEPLFLDQPALARHILERVLQFVPANGPCSLIRLNRFISERDQYRKPGRIFDTEHINPPHDLIVKAWLLAANFSANPIEKAIYRKFSPDGLEYGATRYAQIFPVNGEQRRKLWKTTDKGEELYQIARKNKVSSLGYFWVRCAPDDLWFFSLRRRNTEPPFNDNHSNFLYGVAKRLYEEKDRWYCRPLRWLSPMERRIVGAMCYKTYEFDVARKSLKMEPKTYSNHQENIYKKLREMGYPIKTRVSLLEFLRQSTFNDQKFL